MRNLRETIGGPDGITLRGWAYLFPWSIWLAMGFSPNQSGIIPATWVFIGILAHINTGIALLFGKVLLLRDVRKTPKFITTVGLYIFAGVVRGLSTGYYSLIFKSASEPNYLVRITICIVAVPLWLSLTAIVINAQRKHRERVGELLSEKNHLLSLIESHNRQIVEFRNQVIALVKDSVHRALETLQGSRNASSILLETSENVIRPLSHELAYPQLTFENTKFDLTDPDKKRVNLSRIFAGIRQEAAFPVGFLPLLFIFTALPTFLQSAGLAKTLMSIAYLILIYVVGFSVAERVTKEWRRRSILGGWLLVLGTWITVTILIGIAIHSVMKDVPRLSSSGISASVLIFIGVLLASVAQATYREWRNIEREFESSYIARAWEENRARTLLNTEQERLSAAIHSGIQSVLVSAALRLKNEKVSQEALHEFAKEIEKSCQKILHNEDVGVSINESLNSIINVWNGVAEVDVQIKEDLLDRADRNPTFGYSLLTLTREGLSNAMRHGRANRVVISGEINESQAELVIKDNGRFKEKIDVAGHGSALYSRLSTEWKIERTHDRWTELSLKIPVS